MTDSYIRKNHHGMVPILANLGLEARFVPAEDDTVDDTIEIRKADAGDDDDLADVQFCDRKTYCANSWTNAERTMRWSGPLRDTAEKAMVDALQRLKSDGLI